MASVETTTSAELAQELEANFEAQQKLKEAPLEIRKKQAEAKDSFVQDLAAQLVAGRFTLDNAIESYRKWRIIDDAFPAKKTACEELGKLLSERIEELKVSHGSALKEVAKLKVGQLAVEIAGRTELSSVLDNRKQYLERLIKAIEDLESKPRPQAK